MTNEPQLSIAEVLAALHAAAAEVGSGSVAHLLKRALAPHGVIHAITGLPQECADLQKG
jgi:hypothetical protein